MSKALRTHIERIAPLADDEFKIVLAHFSSKKLKKHQFVIQEGDMVPFDIFVVKGLLKACYIDQEGKEHIVQFAMEDEWISDDQAYVESFLD
jgi:CRP-like cAMP-binding protein